MSLCSVDYEEGEMEWVLGQRITNNRDDECNLCGDTIPAGDQYLQKFYAGEGEGFVHSRCAWCEDAFHGSEVPDYHDSGQFAEAMILHLDNTTEQELFEVLSDWLAKPEPYRREFNRRWPDVEETLFRYVHELRKKDDPEHVERNEQ